MPKKPSPSPRCPPAATLQLLFTASDVASHSSVAYPIWIAIWIAPQRKPTSAARNPARLDARLRRLLPVWLLDVYYENAILRISNPKVVGSSPARRSEKPGVCPVPAEMWSICPSAGVIARPDSAWRRRPARGRCTHSQRSWRHVLRERARHVCVCRSRRRRLGRRRLSRCRPSQGL